MRRGINHKRINLTLDQTSLSLLEKYRKWGTPMSVHVRRALVAYERGRAQPQVAQVSPEESAITYD